MVLFVLRSEQLGLGAAGAGSSWSWEPGAEPALEPPLYCTLERKRQGHKPHLCLHTMGLLPAQRPRSRLSPVPSPVPPPCSLECQGVFSCSSVLHQCSPGRLLCSGGEEQPQSHPWMVHSTCPAAPQPLGTGLQVLTPRRGVCMCQELSIDNCNQESASAEQATVWAWGQCGAGDVWSERSPGVS